MMARSPNRLLGLIVGVAFIVIGLLGFVVTGGSGFFTTDGGLLLGVFQVNVFHSVAHLVLGGILAAAAIASRATARTANRVIGSAYLALGIAGFFLAGSSVNILAINAADTVLHFAAAVVLLAVGFGVERPEQAELRT